MKDLKELVEELEKEVGSEVVVMAEVVEENSAPRDGVMESSYPVSDSGDVILGVRSMESSRFGTLHVVSLIYEKGMRTYLLDTSELSSVSGDLSSILRDRDVYTTEHEMERFEELFFPLTPAKVKFIDRVPRHMVRGIDRGSLLARGAGGGMAMILGRFMEHMFTVYHVYLRMKQNAKNINYGKYKVAIKV